MRFLSLLLLACLTSAPLHAATEEGTGKPGAHSTADHTKFKELQQTFKSGQEVPAPALPAIPKQPGR